MGGDGKWLHGVDSSPELCQIYVEALQEGGVDSVGGLRKVGQEPKGTEWVEGEPQSTVCL